LLLAISVIYELVLYFFVYTGERTFGVLTKIDLMDKGTDAVDVSSDHLTIMCSTLAAFL
jgi:hypothetical protein